MVAPDVSRADGWWCFSKKSVLTSTQSHTLLSTCRQTHRSSRNTGTTHTSGSTRLVTVDARANRRGSVVVAGTDTRKTGAWSLSGGDGLLGGQGGAIDGRAIGSVGWDCLVAVCENLVCHGLRG